LKGGVEEGRELVVFFRGDSKFLLITCRAVSVLRLCWGLRRLPDPAHSRLGVGRGLHTSFVVNHILLPAGFLKLLVSPHPSCGCARNTRSSIKIASIISLLIIRRRKRAHPWGEKSLAVLVVQRGLLLLLEAQRLPLPCSEGGGEVLGISSQTPLPRRGYVLNRVPLP